MTWLIWNTSSRAYVAPPGSRCSFTPDIRKARLFRTLEAAKQECCPGNEYPVTLESQFSNH